MTLPDWLDPLWEAAEMRAADKHAIEDAGVPSLDLMERAGAGLARAVADVAADGPIRVVIGKGNNGGDGLVVARLLREDGHEVDVLAVGNPDELQGDALANLDRLPGAQPIDFDADRLAGSAAIVDAMLGTGFEGEPREPVAGAIAAINACDAPVVACDVPSGVNASTGEVSGEAVEADVTATFHGPKVGLYVEPGKSHAGRVEVVEIGVPRSAPMPGAAGLIADRVLGLVPPRPRSGNKFKSGTVVVAGGARGLTGAPTMAALSAMRTGAGYVQLAVPEPAETVLDLKLMEAMTHALPHENGAHVEEGADKLVELSERAGAIVLGPGIGRSDGAVAFARRVAREVKVPLLIDADGLNAHAEELGLLAQREAPTILTPHDGELGRLLGIESSAVGEHRIAHARKVAEQSGAIVVLKGDDTLVVPPEGPIAISAGGTPALATAGTGDVLSGLIGALLAKEMDPFAAACAGVFAHARAGRIAAERIGADHVIAGDVIDALPRRIAAARMIERAVAHIDLGAIERNCAHIREQIGDAARLCAVVKANAYGHGDTWCAKAALAGGAEWLAVAAAGEAVELRRHGIDSPLLIMGALTNEDARLALEAPADVVAWEPEFAHALARVADSAGVTGRVHVKLDSGMGRLGTKDPEQALAVAQIVEDAEHLQLVGLMTHFATADEQGDDYFPQQLETFTEFATRFRERWPDVIVHAANSPATFRDPAAHFDLVRCGVAVYGLDPFQEDPALRGLEPALALHSYVAAVRRFEPGDSAGYGRAWTASEATWVGTLPIGYGDGWRRDLTNNADVLIDGRRYPLVGRVSMDNITVDLGSDTAVKPGTGAVLIGRSGDERITTEDLARRTGTINYDITCALSQRVRRHWSAA